MPSQSLHQWLGERTAILDEMEAAHRSVGGVGRGRRHATEQINHAYSVLLSAQFQGFCRNLHSECADSVARVVVPGNLGPVIRQLLLQGRKLDSQNPNPGNLGSDFGRFSLLFWDDVRRADVRVDKWKDDLEELNVWRNAIAHQDFDPVRLGATALRIFRVRSWRRSCNGLAQVFDRVMRNHVFTLVGQYPWP